MVFHRFFLPSPILPAPFGSKFPSLKLLFIPVLVHPVFDRDPDLRGIPGIPGGDVIRILFLRLADAERGPSAITRGAFAARLGGRGLLS